MFFPQHVFALPKNFLATIVYFLVVTLDLVFALGTPIVLRVYSDKFVC